MRWEAFGGVQFLAEATRRADRILELLKAKENPSRISSALIRKIEDLGGHRAQCSLESNYQSGYQCAIQEVLELLRRRGGDSMGCKKKGGKRKK